MILSLALVGLVGASGIAFSVIYFDSYDYRIQTVSDEYNHQTLMQELKRTSIGADSVRFRLLGDDAYMAGTLDSDAPFLVNELLERHPNLDTIVMVNVPGTIDSERSLKAALQIHEAEIETLVPTGGEIASGGVDFFAAGVPHRAEKGARIGVHAWAYYYFDLIPDSGAASHNRDDPLHQKYLDFYDQVDVDKSFYVFTLRAAPPSGLHYMSEAEIDRYFR